MSEAAPGCQNILGPYLCCVLGVFGKMDDKEKMQSGAMSKDHSPLILAV